MMTNARKFRLALTSLMLVVLLLALDGFSANISGINIESESTSQWTAGGPYGGYINSLAMAPTNSDVIYAGTESGLFKTTDAGASWTKTEFPGMFVRAVQVAPDNPGIVYAGTDDGIYKTEDGGDNWTHKGLSDARVNAIAIDPTNSNVLHVATGIWYAAESDVGVYKSVDGGDNWEKMLDKTDISTHASAVYTVLIDCDNSQIVYAGVDGWTKQVYKSIDGGVNWVGKDVGRYTGPDVVALAMTPAGFSPATIYAMLEGHDVYKSTDRGETWEATGTPWISPGSPWALAVDPNDPNVVYVGTHYYQGRFYKSPDGGDTWSIKVNGLPPACPSSIVVDPQNSDIYVGLEEGGVYKSTDGAESWNSSSQGMNNAFIRGLAVDPTSSDTAFAAIKGAGHYLAKTTNGGSSWHYLVDSPTDLGAVTIDPQNPSAVYAGRGWRTWTNIILSIEKSTDGGQSWIDTGKLFTTWGTFKFGVSDIWVDPSDPSTILVAVAGFGGWDEPGGVYKSINGGATWQRTRDFWANTLAADPTNPEVLYFGSERCGYVFRSTDTGSNWTNISPSAPPQECWVSEVRDIEVDLNSNVYAATDEGLMKWEGSDWAKLPGLPTDDITALTIDRAVSPGIVYVGTEGEGVFVSQDGGSTWSEFSQGLDNLNTTKLAISASQPKVLYAGTKYGGVYSCMIGEPNNPPCEPTDPSPVNHATDVSIEANLSWAGGDPDAGDTVTYNVYFGTSETPPFKETIGPHAANQTSLSYELSTLAYKTTYYWQIIATDNHEAETTGPVWDFTTAAAWDPWAYDEDDSNYIEIGELLQAINDYIGGDITISQLLQLINLYITHTHK